MVVGEYGSRVKEGSLSVSYNKATGRIDCGDVAEVNNDYKAISYYVYDF